MKQKTLNKRKIGSEYEKKAASFLKQQGYRILEQNYRDRTGEIDIVAEEGEYLVFVEVKYRRDLRNGYPEEAVSMKKQQKIRHTASWYLYSHHRQEETPCRFDVVSITGDQIFLIRNAF